MNNTSQTPQFHLFLPQLLRFEGGFVHDSDDPGGATNKGVTFSTFKSCARALLHIEPSFDNLQKLSDEQAGIIYKARYWDSIRCDEFPCQELANIVFDFHVNAGGAAIRLLQLTLNRGGAALKVDSAVGPKTIAALRKANPAAVYAAYRRGRAKYYQDLAQRRPKLKKFLRGWLKRVNHFPPTIAG